jgi:hypothetical protein
VKDYFLSRSFYSVEEFTSIEKYLILWICV